MSQSYTTRSAPPAPALRLYVAAVAAGGVLALVKAASDAPHVVHPAAWLTLAAIALLAGSFRFVFASVSANIAIDDTILLAMALLYGPAPATLAIAAGGLALSVRRRQTRTQVIFNTSALAVSMWVAAQTFFLIARVRPLAQDMQPVGTLVLPLLAMTAVYFALNSGLTAVAVALDSLQSPIAVWRRHFQWLSVNYFAAASVAFCVILLIQQASLLALLLVLPLFGVFHLTLRASFGRIHDAQQHFAEMDRLYLSTVETLAMAIDAKDDVTHSHVRRVQAYATGLARALSVTDAETIKAIEAAALLHDTGKLAVPEHILNKPGKLTEAEFEKMKLHVDIGADILSLVRFPYPVEPIVRCHHENWDGSGYPRGVIGESIPIGARILSVVDCFDALTSDRPYRRRLSDEAAIAILRERSGTMYDPTIVEMFISMYRQVQVDVEETPEQREVLQRISATRHDVDAAPAAAPAPFGMTHDLLAFVSLARVVSREASVLDVLSLASNLVADIVPGVTGAWYLPSEGCERLVVADAFGPAASYVHGMSVGTGERLTGWVAASRQPIIDSDAALDLGARAPAAAAAGIRRCMSIPLSLGNSLVAVLTLYAKDAATFSGDRAQLIQVVAPHLASTIDAAVRAEAEQRAAAVPDRTTVANRDLRLVSAR
jgi:HD-GYP domain-containing protein (c-di-GMP phosphodiesterase class II)